MSEETHFSFRKERTRRKLKKNISTCLQPCTCLPAPPSPNCCSSSLIGGDPGGICDLEKSEQLPASGGGGKEFTACFPLCPFQLLTLLAASGSPCNTSPFFSTLCCSSWCSSAPLSSMLSSLHLCFQLFELFVLGCPQCSFSQELDMFTLVPFFEAKLLLLCRKRNILA